MSHGTARLHTHATTADDDVINWANFISQCFNGLVLGALLALISSGLTIIYGTLGVLNLAHGAMFMLGGYAGWRRLQLHAARSSSPSSPARCSSCWSAW